MNDNVEPHGFTKLGGKERPADKRDFKLGSAAPVQIPATYMQNNAWSAPIYYQAKQPACGAHAGAWLSTLLDSYSGTTPQRTPRFTWIDVKTFDGYAIDDGTDMRSIFKSLTSEGADDFMPLGNDSSLSEAQYASATSLTAAMKDNAATHKMSNYAFVNNPTFAQLKQLIYQNRGVIMLLQVNDQMWTAPNGKTSWAEKDVLPLRIPNGAHPNVDGHFVVAHSYDDNYIYFANSWGNTWGRTGHGYFGSEYMPYVLEAGTATTVAQWVTDNLQKQVTLYAMIVQLLQKLKILKNG